MPKILIFLLVFLSLTFQNNHRLWVLAKEALYLAYPPENHQTNSDRIFFIGSGLNNVKVMINNQEIKLSKQGYFAPSFPLEIGENTFTIRQGDTIIKRTIIRTSIAPNIPAQLGFDVNSLSPQENISILAGEKVCFEAIATPNAQVSVNLGHQNIVLTPQSQIIELPSNSAVLTHQNTTQKLEISQYQGCDFFSQQGNLGNPQFQLTLNNETITQVSPATLTILDPSQLKVIEIISEQGVSRTGPSTDYSRLTPLPQGTQAVVTAQQGEWLRLDYGGWIQEKETKILNQNGLPDALVRGISATVKPEETEILFPLKRPVPIKIKQQAQSLTLTLYNTVAQTDTIYLPENPLIEKIDWEQTTPNQIEYTLSFKTSQQWGYIVKYEGNNLKLSLRHPPQTTPNSLKGISILLDPGHGGNELGAKGPTGYPEKSINLVISQQLEKELKRRGATIYLTRETDQELSLPERVKMIDQLKPTLALSIHYNALPDSGDALNTAGIGAFWYHPQSYELAQFLHQYLVTNLNRPSYGVYWNNLALTRPHSSPSILLELGFMINPDEFEWIINPQEQQKLVETLATGIEEWIKISN